ALSRLGQTPFEVLDREGRLTAPKGDQPKCLEGARVGRDVGVACTGEARFGEFAGARVLPGTEGGGRGPSERLDPLGRRERRRGGGRCEPPAGQAARVGPPSAE